MVVFKGRERKSRRIIYISDIPCIHARENIVDAYRETYIKENYVMERLNYFYPYTSKEAQHEDQLTRAYLVLLKHSSNAFSSFLKYCGDKIKLEKNENRLSFAKYNDNDWLFDTQKGNPIIETDYLLSVLITDKNINNKRHVSSSKRDARYDGIITLNHKLTIIIENKPNSNYVWADQLKPSKQNLSEKTKIYKNPIILEWKVIIQHLNHLQSIPTTSRCEKILIEDFLSFVDENFPSLNPYDNLSLCKNNKDLLNRRIENILKSIVRNPKNVNYHKTWAYNIETPFEQIKKIGLYLEWEDENDWELILQLNFADSQNQAISFYNSNLNISKIKKLNDWALDGNFHVFFGSKHLVWFKSKKGFEEYIKYWKDNIESIKRIERKNVEKYLKFLEKNNIISYNNNEKNEMKEKFFNTKRKTLNISPGFTMWFYISAEEAIKKDKDSKLEKYISEKIKEGLSAVNLKWEKILK
jgi:hypothetical protein